MSTSRRVMVGLLLLPAVFSACSDDDVAAPPVGTITIDAEPNSISAPWEIAGPDGFGRTGSGDATFTDVPAGEHTVIWGDVSGWTAPSPRTEARTLATDGVVAFSGTYAVQAGTITIDPEPNSIDAPWELTGPGDVHLSGAGNRTLTDQALGNYTLAWGGVAGWTTPDPATQALTLEEDGALEFTGSYTVQAGTITIDPDPNSVDAPWRLTGPGGLDQSGHGNLTLTSMVPGSYTHTWAVVDGWTTPDPAATTMVLATDGTLTFSGTYVARPGSITVDPEPDSIDAPWELVGPNGFDQTGSGNAMLGSVGAGSYTLVWGAVPSWVVPEPQTQVLVANGAVTFTGSYLIQPCAMAIDPQPDGLAAPWEIAGPDGYRLTGSGAANVVDLEPGTYSLTWGAMPDYATPPALTQTRVLAPGESATFAGTYVQVGGGVAWVTCLPGTFAMGSPISEPGHDGVREIQHTVTLTQAFYMSKYEVTEAWWFDVMGTGTPGLQLPRGNVSWDLAVRFCNALSLRENLTPAYTIHGADGDVTWNRSADGYRLPTEAEWEYACRAGTTLAFNNDSDCLSAETHANYDGRHPLSSCASGIYRGGRTAVGSFPSNELGLHDMHGNLWEWVWDGYRGDYQNLPSFDPAYDAGPGVPRILRGGGWGYSADVCRSASRFSFAPNYPYYSDSFRPVRSAD